tara:strand:+ start:383 stop:643 length:261 start_codon:yes stop_codon:yes gene_type:complete
MKIIHENCDPELANDKTLPNNAFLIEYKVDGVVCYDITSAAKQSEIFDHYYDKYKSGFVTMRQAEGRISPKLWGNEPPKSKNKKRK